jgi:hypothetical protein
MHGLGTEQEKVISGRFKVINPDFKGGSFLENLCRKIYNFFSLIFGYEPVITVTVKRSIENGGKEAQYDYPSALIYEGDLNWAVTINVLIDEKNTRIEKAGLRVEAQQAASEKQKEQMESIQNGVAAANRIPMPGELAYIHGVGPIIKNRNKLAPWKCPKNLPGLKLGG